MVVAARWFAVGGALLRAENHCRSVGRGRVAITSALQRFCCLWNTGGFRLLDVEDGYHECTSAFRLGDEYLGIQAVSRAWGIIVAVTWKAWCCGSSELVRQRYSVSGRLWDFLRYASPDRYTGTGALDCAASVAGPLYFDGLQTVANDMGQVVAVDDMYC